jgi:hypothetical protein
LNLLHNTIREKLFLIYTCNPHLPVISSSNPGLVTSKDLPPLFFSPMPMLVSKLKAEDAVFLENRRFITD